MRRLIGETNNKPSVNISSRESAQNVIKNDKFSGTDDDFNRDVNEELMETCMAKWLLTDIYAFTFFIVANINKSKYLIFAMPNKRIQIPEIRLDSIGIENVSAFNFLGLTIDEQLNNRRTS